MKRADRNSPDFSNAFGRADREFVFCVENTLRELKAREEAKRMKKKIPLGVVIVALILLLAMGTAIAMSINWSHIEKAMDIARESGEYDEWSLKSKISLIESMKEDGIEIDEKDWKALEGEEMGEEEKNALADEILTGYYGDQEFLYYYTIAEIEWGVPPTWTLEQKHWFYQMEREKGLLRDDSWIDLLPEKGDLRREEAVEIARKAVMDAYELSEEEMRDYGADVSFFITQDCQTPRWEIDFHPLDNAYFARYSVLLTREGEITEDERLGIMTPGDRELQERTQAQPPKVMVRKGG